MLSRIPRILVYGLLLSLFLGGVWRVAASSGLPQWGPQAAEPTVKVVDTNYQASQEALAQCHDHDFVLQTSDDFKHPFDKVYQDTTYGQCAFYTNFGLVGTSVLFLNNSPQPYHISSSSINGNIYTTPNSRSLFVQDGPQLEAYDNPEADFQVGQGVDYMGPHTSYKNEYYLRDGVVPRILKDSHGQKIQGITHTKSSPNGQWLIMQRSNQLLRVRANDFNNLLTFPGDSKWYGEAPKSDMAISNDGRYVAVIARDHLSFKMYDLATCTPDPSYNLTNATGCAPVDMVPFMQEHLVGVYRIDMPKFSDDGKQLSVRATVQSGSTAHNDLVILSTPGADDTNPLLAPSNYIALGDSYASGEGAYNYFSGTDESANKCHLSKRSYPYLLGLKLQLDSVHSVACSGARMINVNGYGLTAAQHTDRPYNAYSNYWLPGYNPQLQYLEENQPNIVTVSMVGNDVGFADIIKRCILFPDTCYASDEDRLGLVENINSKFDSLVAMYTQIKAAAAPEARVYILGYPSIVKPDGNCGLNVHLNQQETEFASNLTTYLDYVINLAATKAGVKYVDTQSAIDGFRLCDEESADISAVNGLTAGNDTLGVIGQESYHPTGFGHQLLASTIANLTDDMSAADPEPIWGINGPDMLLASDYLHIADASQSVPQIEFDDMEPNTPLLRGAPVTGSLPASLFHLDFAASYDVWLHSTPVKLGSVQSDGDGNVTYSFTIPHNIEPGWHTIDVLGNNISGHAVDIQRIIYIAAAADDWNGNGVSNSKEPCGLVPASGVDADHDGIDDACDGVIGQPGSTDGQPPTTGNSNLVTNKSGNNGSSSLQSSDNGEAGTLLKRNPAISLTATPSSTPAVLGVHTTNPTVMPHSTHAPSTRKSNQATAVSRLTGWWFAAIPAAGVLFVAYLVLIRRRQSS